MNYLIRMYSCLLLSWNIANADLLYILFHQFFWALMKLGKYDRFILSQKKNTRTLMRIQEE